MKVYNEIMLLLGNNYSNDTDYLVLNEEQYKELNKLVRKQAELLILYRKLFNQTDITNILKKHPTLKQIKELENDK